MCSSDLLLASVGPVRAQPVLRDAVAKVQSQRRAQPWLVHAAELAESAARRR